MSVLRPGKGSCTGASRKNDALSFKLNGTLYEFKQEEFSGSSPGGHSDSDFIYLNSLLNDSSTPGVSSHPFPYQFRIVRYDGALCGALVAKDYPWPFQNECELPENDLAGNPLSAEKVYFLASGSLSFSKKDCGKRPSFFILCFCRLEANICDVFGTFELKFKNGLNETITLSKGKIALYDDAQ